MKTRTDLPNLPRSWRYGRLQEVADTRTSNVDKHTIDGQPLVRLCNYVDVYHNETIDESIDFMEASATEKQIERFRLNIGDTIITKDSESADDIGIPAFVETQSAELICGYHLALVRPRTERIIPKFLFWTLQSKLIFAYWETVATGITRVGLKLNDLSRATIPIPTLDEQTIISDYLDREIQKIDQLIAEQRGLIDSLKERRRAAITRLITQGTGENNILSNAKTEWLDYIPSSWTLTRLRYIASIEGKLVDPRSEEMSKRILIAPNHIESKTGHIQSLETAAEQGADSNKYQVRKDQIIYSKIRPTLNKAAISPIDCLCSADMYPITFNKVNVDSRYALYQLLSQPIHDYVTEQSMRVKMPKINREELKDAPWILPPINVQRMIADEIDAQVSNIDNLIADSEDLISLSQERRAALITAAVTGQIDVQEMQ